MTRSAIHTKVRRTLSKQPLLLVERDAKTRRLLKVSLEQAGYVVISARDGADALKKLELATFSLVLSATELPKLDGYALVRRMKDHSEWARIPVVFMTPSGSLEDKIRGMELGVEEFIQKPVFVRELLSRVQVLLAKRVRQHLSESTADTRVQGSLSDLPPVDLLESLETGEQSGVVRIGRGGKRAEIFFQDGEIVDATLEKLRGEEAVFRVLGFTEGTFEVEIGDVDVERIIDSGMRALMESGMRHAAEVNRLRAQLPDAGGDPVLRVNRDSLVARMGRIPASLEGMLALLDGDRSLDDVIDDSPFDDLSTLQTIAKLFGEGLIEHVVAEPEPESEPEPAPAPEPEPARAEAEEDEVTRPRRKRARGRSKRRQPRARRREPETTPMSADVAASSPPSSSPPTSSRPTSSRPTSSRPTSSRRASAKEPTPPSDDLSMSQEFFASAPEPAPPSEELFPESEREVVFLTPDQLARKRTTTKVVGVVVGVIAALALIIMVRAIASDGGPTAGVTSADSTPTSAPSATPTSTPTSTPTGETSAPEKPAPPPSAPPEPSPAPSTSASADGAPDDLPDVEDPYKELFRLVNSGAMKKAVPFGYAAIKKEPDNGDAYYLLGEALRGAQKPDEANQIFKECVAKATKGQYLAYCKINAPKD